MKRSPNILIPTLAEMLVFAGHVRHIVDGQVVHEKHNAIDVSLKSYLQSVLDSNTDNAINSLFDTAEVAPGGAQDGNDGICVYDNDTATWLSMVTTTMAANNTYGKRWQGEIASLSQARTINESALGYDYEGTNADHFSTIYATQSFTGIPLTAGANYIIEWEIYIQ